MLVASVSILHSVECVGVTIVWKHASIHARARTHTQYIRYNSASSMYVSWPLLLLKISLNEWKDTHRECECVCVGGGEVCVRMLRSKREVVNYYWARKKFWWTHLKSKGIASHRIAMVHLNTIEANSRQWRRNILAQVKAEHTLHFPIPELIHVPIWNRFPFVYTLIMDGQWSCMYKWAWLNEQLIR